MCVRAASVLEGGPGRDLRRALTPRLSQELLKAPTPSSAPPSVSHHAWTRLAGRGPGGLVPRPTQTLADTGQGRGAGEQWGGTANQSSSCPARGILRTASPGQRGALRMPERIGKVGRGSGTLPPRAWWGPELGAAGRRCLVRLHGPGARARGCTLRAMHGAGGGG